MKIIVKYPAGHTIEREWLRSPSYCPSCGKMEVWAEQGEGDYEYGPDCICVACGVLFTIQGPCAVDPEKKNHAHGKTEPDAHNQQLEQLRKVLEVKFDQPIIGSDGIVQTGWRAR